jgi:AcrR family transcriptional regulator
MGRMNAPAPPSDWTERDTPKSRRTRARILDAAMTLFAELGYDAATNAAIADHAKLTRGAMLYHFPTRETLLAAAAGHIQAARAALMKSAAEDRPSGVDAADHEIDSYWRLLKTAPFRAFAELEHAARTDPGIARLIAPAQDAFDRAEGLAPRLQTSRDLARFMLEGLSRARLTHDEAAREERLLAVIKRATQVLNRRGAAADLWSD